MDQRLILMLRCTISRKSAGSSILLAWHGSCGSEVHSGGARSAAQGISKMTRSTPSLFARHDTFFGVCEALGEDFRFSPNWLRLAVAVGLLVAPLVTLAAYLGMGVVV